MAAATAQQTSGRRWVVLAVATFAQTAACAFVYGVPFLVPDLRDQFGLSLAAAGAYVAAPTAGLLTTLILWGAAADRFGERKVMASGLLLAALAVGVVGLTPGIDHGLVLALLVVGGASAASVFAACGRMIMGWFPRTERGLAMGIRQTAQPLGVAVAGLLLPGLAQRYGVFGALVVPAGLCLLAALLVIVAAPDPERPARAPGEHTSSPYRTPVLWRLHAASAMLVVPQFAIGAFAAEYLVRQQGWSTTAAGAFVAVIQIAGAFGRIGSGVWSDRVGSRLRPMRQLAVGATLVLLTFALGDAVAPGLAIRRARRRRRRDGGGQRAGVHRRRGDRRADVVGPGVGNTEHRAEHRRLAHAGRARRARRGGGLRGRVRDRRPRADRGDRPHSGP